MRLRVWLIAALALGLPTACFGPTEAQLDCYRGCSTAKDACILEAMTAAQVQSCDARSSNCTATCQ